MCLNESIVEAAAFIPTGQEHILGKEDDKKRWVQLVTELSSAFALCAGSDEATRIRDDVSFFQALQAALNKRSSNNRKTPEQIEAAIRQLVSRAITTEGQVIDVFTAAGLPKPDISILRDQFLAEVRGLKHKNVAAELLENLLKDELKPRERVMATQERHRGRLIDHIGLVVRDIAASKDFYCAVFSALNIPIGGSDASNLWADELFISSPASDEVQGALTGRQHIAFQAHDRAMVDAFHQAALAHGGRDNGAPGERAYHPGYYAAFVLDPDDNNIEAVSRDGVTRSAASVRLRY